MSRTVNAADREEALQLAGRIRWFVGYSDKIPTSLRNDMLGVAADLEAFAGLTEMLIKSTNQPTSTVDDPVSRTKADPNRSYREDALVAEIERLRAEKAITADLLRHHLEKSQAVGWQPIETAAKDGTDILGWDGRSTCLE